MDQHSVMISIFAMNQIHILEVGVILVIHIIYQTDTDMVKVKMVKMQKIFWLEIMMNGQQLKLKSIK